MFVRNLLRPSDFVTLVPVGMPTTLQYDARGILEKVYWGYTEEDRVDMSSRILAAAKPTDEVKPFPFKIPIKDGTTFIMGVLYSNIDYNDSQGVFPECIQDEFLNTFECNPGAFHFFAANAESMAAKFNGCTNTRRWLDMSGFDILPGFLAPATLTPESFSHCMNHCQYNFQNPKVSSYIIFRGTNVLYEHTGMKQHIVSTVSRYADPSGNIKAKVTFKDGSDCMYVDYSDLVHFHIKTNTMVITDRSGNIVLSHPTDDKKRDKYKSNITCEYCGMSFDVPESGLVTCPNEGCMSHQYPSVCNMLRVFNLPELSFNDYKDAALKGQITMPADVLDLPIYSDARIRVSYAQLIEAVVPVTVIPDKLLFVSFANQCNNSLNTIVFYLQNPNKILTNLSLNSIHLTKFIGWLNDPVNSTEIINMLNHPRIEFTGSDRKFEGSPIFNNKTIMITGKFSHGNTGEIISILNSYSATVVIKYSDDVQCLVVGDIPEDVNGVAVRKCKHRGVPVFTETQFFKKFQIDEDLVQNLL